MQTYVQLRKKKATATTMHKMTSTMHTVTTTMNTDQGLKFVTFAINLEKGGNTMIDAHEAHSNIFI